ncbi:hypothetical protein DRO33_02890 [Candidatus Bathyarchaeota archaeon]|nr:MAG: hypothetical protein DRO33_02890 [Candidatus Bathyarchaeota archaeon]
MSRSTTPRLDGLKRFLEAVKALGPVSVYRVALVSGLPYVTAYRYMRYCLEKGLVESLREQDSGSRGSLRLVLTERGLQLLEALRCAEIG